MVFVLFLLYDEKRALDGIFGAWMFFVVTNLSIQDVFRKIKADNPGYLLAFGVSDVFEFRGCDAVAVHEALPDVLFDTEVDFKRITVHKFAFFPFYARLKACGLKVAMVARHRVPGKRVYYEISGKSDE